MERGKAILWGMVATLLAAQPAGAEDVLKKIFKRLDKAGRDFEEKIIGKDKVDRTGDVRTAWGTCQVYSPTGIQTDNDPCKNEEVCFPDKTCFQRFIWPSGSVTILEKRGGSWALNGERASVVSFRGETCLQVSTTGNFFCYWNADVAVPDLSVRDPVAVPTPREPPTGQAEIGSDPGSATTIQSDDALESGGLAETGRQEKLAGDLAEAERQRAETIAAEQAEMARRKEEEDKRAAEAAARKAKEDAEQQAKIDLIAALSSQADIDRFFREATLATLRPVDAPGKCVDHFLLRAAAIAKPVPIDAAAGIQGRCSRAADEYGLRLLATVADGLAAKTRALPATLEGLRANLWFKPDAAVLAPFAEHHVEALLARYDAAIASHRNAAIASALTEIAKAFQAAVPLAESGDAALALCAFEGVAPNELANACASQQEGFLRRTEVARCEYAVSNSGASEYMLDLPVEAVGDREKWPLRKLLCVGANRRPEFRFSVGNGRIPLLTAPSLSVEAENDKDILDVEFRISSPRDGRSFTQLLLDILTGENEKPVREVLIVERIRYALPHLSNFPRQTIVGCTLGIVECE